MVTKSLHSIHSKMMKHKAPIHPGEAIKMTHKTRSHRGGKGNNRRTKRMKGGVWYNPFTWFSSTPSTPAGPTPEEAEKLKLIEAENAEKMKRESEIIQAQKEVEEKELAISKEQDVIESKQSDLDAAKAKLEATQKHNLLMTQQGGRKRKNKKEKK